MVGISSSCCVPSLAGATPCPSTHSAAQLSAVSVLPHRPAQARLSTRSKARHTAPAPGAPPTARSPLRSRRAQPAPAATACTVRAARAAATIGICVRVQAQARAAAPASTCVMANAPPRVLTRPPRSPPRAPPASRTCVLLGRMSLYSISSSTTASAVRPRVSKHTNGLRHYRERSE